MVDVDKRTLNRLERRSEILDILIIVGFVGLMLFLGMLLGTQNCATTVSNTLNMSIAKATSTCKTLVLP